MLISSSTSSSGTQVTRRRLPSQLGRGSEAPKSGRGGGAHLVGWAIKRRAGGAGRPGAGLGALLPLSQMLRLRTTRGPRDS